MGTYVAHRSAPATRYAELGDTQLLGLFSTDQWGKLSFSEKLDACQEVENRYAAAHNCEPCTVRAEPMTGATFGYQNNHSICLNEGVVRDGVFLTEDVDENGATVLVPVDVRASNWQTLETVFHEGTHGIQESRGQMPGTYFDPESDYDIYRIQPCEKEAFQAGQENTLRAMAVVQAAEGKQDQNAADYLAAVKAASYEASLEAAARNYGDENIDVTLGALIQHREYGLTLQNPSESYKALGELLDRQDRQLVEAQNEADRVEGEHRLQQDALKAEALEAGTVRGGSHGAEVDDGLGSALGERSGSLTQGGTAQGSESAGVAVGGATQNSESTGVALSSAAQEGGTSGASFGGAAYGGAAQGAEDGLGSTSLGMGDAPSFDGGGEDAGASNDDGDPGGSSGGGSDRDGGNDSGGGQDGGQDGGGGQDSGGQDM